MKDDTRPDGIDELLKSRDASLRLAVTRAISGAESGAPSGHAGFVTRGVAQVVVTHSGNAAGVIDVAVYRKFPLHNRQSGGETEVWIAGETLSSRPVEEASSAAAGSGAVLLNTLGAVAMAVKVVALTTTAAVDQTVYHVEGGPLPFSVEATPSSSGAPTYVRLTDGTDLGQLSSTGGQAVAGVDTEGEPSFHTIITDASGRQVVVGPAAENAAAAGSPLLAGGRYDLTPRSLDTGAVGGIALDAAGRARVVGANEAGGPVRGGPVQIGGVFMASGHSLSDGTVGYFALDSSARLHTVGAVAENATASGNPNLVAGRYDSGGRSLDDGVVGALALTDSAWALVANAADTPLFVSGTVAEDAAAAGNPVPVGGRYDVTARALEAGDRGEVALDVAGRQIAVGPAATDAAATGSPVLVGGIANAADPSDVDESDARMASFDLAGYLRTVSKAYDALSAADKVSPTLTDADRYLDSEELIDTTNVAAATNYYPSTAGLSMAEFNHLTIQGVLTDADEVITFTVEATLDDAASPDWLDITPAGYELLTDASGSASFVASSGSANFILDFEGLNVQKVRVKSVTGGATNAVQYHIRRRYS